jgi:hypothetical protein
MTPWAMIESLIAVTWMRTPRPAGKSHGPAPRCPPALTAAACLLLTVPAAAPGRRVLCCFNRRRSGDDGNDTNHESFQRSPLFWNSSLLRSARSTPSRPVVAQHDDEALRSGASGCA